MLMLTPRNGETIRKSWSAFWRQLRLKFRRKMSREPLPRFCYECGKTRLEVRLLVRIAQIDLCDECIEFAHVIVIERARASERQKMEDSGT